MNIIINDKVVSKVELLQLIKKSKLKAIKSLRKFANIGLKDAVFIVESLDNDPNYFDDNPVKVTPSGYLENETIKEDVKISNSTNGSNFKSPRAGTHFLKPNRSNKLVVFGLIGFAVLLVIYFLKNNL